RGGSVSSRNVHIVLALAVILAFVPVVALGDVPAANEQALETARERSAARMPKPWVYDTSSSSISAEGKPLATAGGCRVDRLGPNRFAESVNAVRRVEQTSDELCWAASVQMVLATEGIERQQAQLVKMFRPREGHEMGNLGIIVRALCPETESELN